MSDRYVHHWAPPQDHAVFFDPYTHQHSGNKSSPGAVTQSEEEEEEDTDKTTGKSAKARQLAALARQHANSESRQWKALMFEWKPNDVRNLPLVVFHKLKTETQSAKEDGAL